MGRAILDIGCGPNKTPGADGLDAFALPGVDVVWDIEQIPWPVETAKYDVIIASHVLEHVAKPACVLAEMMRILKPGGRAKIRVPHFAHYYYYADLTHIRPFGYRSLDYFDIDRPGRLKYYNQAEFRILKREIRFTNPGTRVDPWKLLGVHWFANHYPKVFERLFVFMFPPVELYFEIEHPKQACERAPAKADE
jgi:SAM-dependent methyltransferase